MQTKHFGVRAKGAIQVLLLLVVLALVVTVATAVFPRKWEMFDLSILTPEAISLMCQNGSKDPRCGPTNGNFAKIVSNGPVAFMDKIFFKDSETNANPSMDDNNTDPYFLEKVVNDRNSGGNQSSLRLTINDDADESFQIWGNSCATTGCSGPGTKSHHFRADGAAAHRGGLVLGNENVPQDLQPGELRADSIKLGKKFKLSGVGDAHGNDGWLRLFGTGDAGFGAAGGYYGGLAVNELWNAGNASFNQGGGTTTTRDLQVNGKTTINGDLRLNKLGVTFDRDWDNQPSLSFDGETEFRIHGRGGPNANLRLDGHIISHSNVFSGNGAATLGADGTVTASKFCIGSTCINEADLQRMKTKNSAGIQSARYVKLVAARVDCMNIGEVRVYDKNGVDVAKGKTVTKSSKYGDPDGYPGAYLVDGNEWTFAHTSCGDQGWMMIDLQSPVAVTKVTVVNRRDCCQERLKGTVVQLLDSSNNVIFTSNPLTGAMSQDVMTQE